MTTLKLLLAVIIIAATKIQGLGSMNNQRKIAHPCRNTDDIYAKFDTGSQEQNQYRIAFTIPVSKNSEAKIKLDSAANVTLDNITADVSEISVDDQDHIVLSFFKNTSYFGFYVRGESIKKIPYMTSAIIKDEEYCTKPLTGFFDSYIPLYADTAATRISALDKICGRRKVGHTELIVNGYSTKPGDWPWHAAIYRLDAAIIRYICGGTLISINVILTAAHCVTIRGSPVTPEIISVILGKYNLIGGDISIQEKEVHSIVVHDDFAQRHLENDIAVLKLRSQVIFDEYVQPACLWNTKVEGKLPQGDLYGTVVGWGIDQTDRLSSQLHSATMPIVSENKCIKRKPVFYANVLNDHKFCAGYANGTSACNGDSGGGFTVFVPDQQGATSDNATGTYHVRGIVSMSVSRKDTPICDPEHYVVFTDIAMYRDWIIKHLDR